MGSYRRWATMIRHVHTAHAQGVTETEDAAEELLLDHDTDRRSQRDRSECDSSDQSGPALLG